MSAEQPPRLLLLCAGDPEGERAFSGSAKSLFSAIAARGGRHAQANVLGWTDPFAPGALPVRVLRRIDRFGLEEAFRWSSWSFARNSRRAERIARQHAGFDAALLYGTTYCPRLDRPMYGYFDATAAQVRAAKAWEFAHFSARKAQRIVDYQRRVFEACTAVFPRSAWAARSVIDDYGIAPEKVLVAGAGVNFRAGPLPHAGYDRQTILFVGSEWERKGGPLLVEAFRRVRAQLPAARLQIVGCSPAVDGPGIEVIGRIDKRAPGGQERLLQLYAEASLFCLLSLFEPFGIVVVEALHSGLPCVVPGRFAFPEMVCDGACGRVLERDDPDELAALLCELLADPDRLAAMGMAAREHAAAHYTWDAAAARILARVARDSAGGPNT